MANTAQFKNKYFFAINHKFRNIFIFFSLVVFFVISTFHTIQITRIFWWAMKDKNSKYSEKNNERWDILAKMHSGAAEKGTAKYYDLEALRDGKTSLFPVEIAELPDLKDKRVLHLQCHFGMDTISLARMGAEVVGVDYSEKAIAIANTLAEELEANATFIHSDIYKLPDLMVDEKESFDFVFTSHGVLCWLSDIAAWGRIIEYFLKPGGQFYVRDHHPFVAVFDNEQTTMDFKVSIPYFNKGKPFRYESEGSYIDEDFLDNPSFVATVSYEWFHTLSDIVMALINAGLTIEFLHEHPTVSWKAFSYTRELENGEWEIDKNDLNMPLTFSILARKAI